MSLLERYNPGSSTRRWSPFDDVLEMQRDINRMFSNFFGRTEDRELTPVREGVWAPVLDVYETKDDLVVRAELPGMSKDEIEITVEGNHLVLRGERDLEHEVDEESYHRIERAYGAFRRALPLPATVDPDKVDATYRNGVLEIRLAKREEAKPRPVKIKAA